MQGVDEKVVKQALWSTVKTSAIEGMKLVVLVGGFWLALNQLNLIPDLVAQEELDDFKRESAARAAELAAEQRKTAKTLWTDKLVAYQSERRALMREIQLLRDEQKPVPRVYYDQRDHLDALIFEARSNLIELGGSTSSRNFLTA